MNALSTAIRSESSLSGASVEAVARDRELARAVGDDEVMASLEQRHALLAQTAVLVPGDGLAQMRQAVAALDGVLRERAPAAAHPGVLGFDFHLTAAGPRLIEINTNPGGLLLVLAQQRVWQRLRPDLKPAGLDADQAEDLALAAFAGQARRIAIVDDAPSGQFLYPEFLLYRQGFIRRGLNAAIVDASRWQGGFDGVYNRLTDFDLTQPDHARLAQDHADGQAVLIPDPASHDAFADKRRLIGLSRHPRCAAWVPPVFAGGEDWERHRRPSVPDGPAARRRLACPAGGSDAGGIARAGAKIAGTGDPRNPVRASPRRSGGALVGIAGADSASPLADQPGSAPRGDTQGQATGSGIKGRSGASEPGFKAAASGRRTDFRGCLGGGRCGKRGGGFPLRLARPGG